MKRRLDRLRRLAVLQARLRDMEERRLAELHRREVEIEEAQHAILEALGRDTLPAGQFGAVLSRQVGRLAADGVDLGQQRQVQAARLAQEAARTRQAERAAEAAERESDHKDRQRTLEMLIEQIEGRKRTSLP